VTAPGPVGAPAPTGQLALGVGLNAAARLENFIPGANGAVLSLLRRLVSGELAGHVYLRGGQGVGKTHLLQACCAQAQRSSARVGYLPLGERDTLSRKVLTGMQSAALICIDDVDRVAGDMDWETGLFNLYNEAEASGARLLFAGRGGPATVSLPDLRSRLSAALLLVLAAPDDALRREVLRQRGHALGFELADDTLAYILARQPRDLGRLTALVDAVDRYALSAKRRVTTALVREYLDRSEAG